MTADDKIRELKALRLEQEAVVKSIDAGGDMNIIAIATRQKALERIAMLDAKIEAVRKNPGHAWVQEQEA